MPKMFDRYLYCPLKCQPPGSKQEESQSQILYCKLLGSPTQLKIIDKYSNNIKKKTKKTSYTGKYGWKTYKET